METTQHLRARNVAIWLTGIGAALATLAFLMPLPDVEDVPLVNDKLVHAVIFCALSLPALVTGLARWPWVVSAALVYGLAIEVTQPLTGRSFDPVDVLANLTGVAVALAVAPWLRRVLGLRTR